MGYNPKDLVRVHGLRPVTPRGKNEALQKKLEACVGLSLERGKARQRLYVTQKWTLLLRGSHK